MSNKSIEQTGQRSKWAVFESTPAFKTIRKSHINLIRDTIELELVKRGISYDQVTINELLNYETLTAHIPRPGHTIVTPELFYTIWNAVDDAFHNDMDEENLE